MQKYISIIIYCMLCVLISSPIKDILIIGNEITTDEFILKTIYHTVGDTINADLANQDMLNLYETGLFDDVTIYAPEDTLYSILLSEKKYTFFKPLVNKDDIIGISLGGSLLFDNIKGENKKIELSVLLGEHSLYNLTYLNPKLEKTQDTLKVDIYNKQFENIENEYIVDRIALHSAFTFPIKKASSIQIGLGYQYNQLKLFTNNYIENNHSLAINMRYQKNALLKTSNNGNTLSLYCSAIFFNKYYHNNSMIGLINKYYIPFLKSSQGRLLIKNQIKINLSKIIPIYEKIYLGTENYIRGYKANPIHNNIEVQNKLKWNNIITSTIQLETSLAKQSYLNVDFLLFLDFGFGANNYAHFKLKNKIRSHGMGIRFDIIKFINLDLCLGINPYGEKEFHVIVNTKKF